MKIGIIGAMAEEIARLRDAFGDMRQQTRGLRDYFAGTFHNQEIVLVFSRWGKVAAASTVTTLIEARDERSFLRLKASKPPGSPP